MKWFPTIITNYMIQRKALWDEHINYTVMSPFCFESMISIESKSSESPKLGQTNKVGKKA